MAELSPSLRQALREAHGSVRAVAARFGVTPKTAQRWRGRDSGARRKPGPPHGQSSTLSREDEMIITSFRRNTGLPLDDCFYALQPTLPHLSRSALHRCLQRHGLSRIKPGDAAVPTEIGHFYVSVTACDTGEGCLYLFFAIDRFSRCVFPALHDDMGEPTAIRFLQTLLSALGFVPRTLCTDGSACFATEIFATVCTAVGVRLSAQLPPAPRLSARAAPPKYRDHAHLRRHLTEFVVACNDTRRLKSLGGRTPAEIFSRALCERAGQNTSQPSEIRHDATDIQAA
jgi:transposase